LFLAHADTCAAKYILVCSAAWELPNFCDRQEVHHRQITLLHRKQFGYLHVPASSRFPASFPPDRFPQLPLLILPLLAVAEEMLPRLGRLPALLALVGGLGLQDADGGDGAKELKPQELKPKELVVTMPLLMELDTGTVARILLETHPNLWSAMLGRRCGT
jgi:hypothetical protein